MPNTQDTNLSVIEKLLEKSEIRYAINALLDLDQKTQAGMRQEIIQQSGNFEEAERNLRRGLIPYDEHSRNAARVRFALLDILKELPGRLESEQQIQALNNFRFDLPEELMKELSGTKSEDKAPQPKVVQNEPPKVTAPASNVPKFVIVYDQADTPQCQLLNKYLNILKITKKIRVYNVQEALAQDLLANAESEIADADYILALVTVNLFNSPDWFGLLLNAMEQGKRLIPIRIEKIGYEGTGLERLLSLPSLNRAIGDFPNQDAAYADIVAELRKLLPK